MVYENRARAESFGASADAYDTYRPTYPAEMIDDLVQRGRPRVLDVGCGTGKAARLFAERGCDVLGIEIDPRMAERARTHGIEVEVAAFEAWDPAGRTFDLVTAGQAWHWVNPVTAPQKAADVLSPQGRIAVFWNHSHGHDPEIDQAISAVVGNRAGDRFGGPQDWRGRHDVASYAEQIEQSRRFAPYEIRSYPWEWQITNEHWIAVWQTWSEVAVMPDAERDALLSDVAGVLARFGDEIVLDYLATCVTAMRLD